MNNIKNCIECGEQLSDAANFCPECHAKQPKKPVEPKIAKAEQKVASKKQEQKSSAAKKTIPVKSKKKETPEIIAQKKPATRKKTATKKKNTIKCPVCGSGSLKIEKKKFRPGMLLLGILGAVAEGIRSQQMQYVCKKCGNKWDLS